MADLVTVEAAKAFLVITGPAEDAAIADAVARASAICEATLGRPVLATSYSNQRMRAPRECAVLLNGPIDVAQALTVFIDNGSELVAQTVWKSEADGSQSGFDVIVGSLVPGSAWGPNVLHRRAGRAGAWPWSSVAEPLVVTYTGGFTTTPEEIREACLLVIQKLYRDQSRAFADVATISSPGGSVSVYDSFLPRRAGDILRSRAKVHV